MPLTDPQAVDAFGIDLREAGYHTDGVISVLGVLGDRHRPLVIFAGEQQFSSRECRQDSSQVAAANLPAIRYALGYQLAHLGDSPS